MALTSGTIFEVRDTATTGNVNGGWFNPANANGVTDLTTDANTANTNSPVVSSATYTFVAGDVGAKLYVVSGTNWTPGWYPIASVSAGKATLSAAVGEAIQRDTTLLPHKYYTNTVAGCATVGTPTNGTFLIDYSQQNTAQATNTDLTCTAGSTTVTSASAPFTRMMVGNGFHITAKTGGGGIASWHEIVSYTDTSNVVLDASPATGTNMTAGTFYVGGACRLNGLEDAMLEIIPASSYIWIKNGTYTISAAVSIASTTSTVTAQSFLIGYNSNRGDNPTGSTRPTLAFGANTCLLGQYQNIRHLNFTTTAANGIGLGTGCTVWWCKSANSSTASGRSGFNGASTVTAYFTEAVAYMGTGFVNNTARSLFYGCWFHDSNIGASTTQADGVVDTCIFSRNDSSAYTASTGGSAVSVSNSTFYGRQAKMATGVNMSGASTAQNKIQSCIFYGLTTALSGTGSDQRNQSNYNVFYNNTNNTSNFTLSATDITSTDPSFTSATEITGTTATSSGSVLTQSGGDFSSVVDGQSYLFIVSGTGVTANRRYGIVSHTSTTITTDNSIGTSSAGDIVYFIGVGDNYAVGSAMAAISAPGVFPGGYTTGYLDPGAVQRPEGSGGSTYVTIIGG